MKEITEKQKKVLCFIKNHIDINEYSPSMRDIGVHFDITARCAWEYVQALKKKEYLNYTSGIARSIRILREIE